jgi:hypothetical protein
MHRSEAQQQQLPAAAEEDHQPPPAAAEEDHHSRQVLRGGVQQVLPPPLYAFAGGAQAPAGGAGGPLLAAGGFAPQQQAAGGIVSQGPPPPAYAPVGGAQAAGGGVAGSAGGLPFAAGGAAPQQPAVGGGYQHALQPQPGGGAGPQLQPGAGAAQVLLVDGLVTAAQAATVRALPDAVALLLVGQSGFPLSGLDPTILVHGKLMVAAWAAEGARRAVDVRALPGPISTQVSMLLGVDATWTADLQDFFLDRVLSAGAAAPWAVDPSQSHGILNSQRMVSLALLASVRVAAAAHNNAEAELTALLSPVELQALRDGLHTAGRSFQDLVKIGGTWSLPPPTGQGGPVNNSSAGCGASTSSLSVSSTMGSFPASSGSGNTYHGPVADASLQAEAERQCDSLKLDTFAWLTSSI